MKCSLLPVLLNPNKSSLKKNTDNLKDAFKTSIRNSQPVSDRDMTAINNYIHFHQASANASNRANCNPGRDLVKKIM